MKLKGGGGVNPMTLKVDLESADPVHGCCTPSHRKEHLGEVNENRSKASENIERTQN